MFTIGWNIIGSPLATVAIPLMITPSSVLPKVVLKGEDGGSLLCHYGRKDERISSIEGIEDEFFKVVERLRGLYDVMCWRKL